MQERYSNSYTPNPSGGPRVLLTTRRGTMFAFHAFPKPCLKGAVPVFLYIKMIFLCTPTKNRTVARKEGNDLCRVPVPVPS